MKTKPILTVGFNCELPAEHVSIVSHNLEKKMGEDYYILAYTHCGIDLKFEVLNADITPLQFDELKEKVQELCGYRV